MKKSISKKKPDNMQVFEATYLADINSNQELTTENQVLIDELDQLKRQNTNVTAEPGIRK